MSLLRRSNSYFDRPSCLVEIRKSNGVSGQANQNDPARRYSPAYYNSERYDCQIDEHRCGYQSRCPDNSADDTETCSDDKFQFGSALRIGVV